MITAERGSRKWGIVQIFLQKESHAQIPGKESEPGPAQKFSTLCVLYCTYFSITDLWLLQKEEAGNGGLCKSFFRRSLMVRFQERGSEPGPSPAQHTVCKSSGSPEPDPQPAWRRDDNRHTPPTENQVSCAHLKTGWQELLEWQTESVSLIFV